MRSLPVLLTSAALVAMASSAFAATPPRQAPACFSSNQWDGWTSPSPDVLLIGVNKDVYRADLAGGSSSLNRPGNFLVSQMRGSTRVCLPIDLDLKVSDDMGFSEPLFVRSLRPLTPEEAAALSKKDDPR